MPNYSDLKTDIINTSENDGTEFSNQVPKFIQKAEFRLVMLVLLLLMIVLGLLETLTLKQAVERV